MCTHSQTHTHSFLHTHSRTYKHALTHARHIHTHSLSFSHTHELVSLKHFLTYYLSLTLSLSFLYTRSCTRTNTHTVSLCVTQTHTNCLFSLSHTQTHTVSSLSLFPSLSLYHTLTSPLSITHTSKAWWQVKYPKKSMIYVMQLRSSFSTIFGIFSLMHFSVNSLHFFEELLTKMNECIFRGCNLLLNNPHFQNLLI